jgi:molybdate transport system ATP-binding protein
MEGRPTLSGSLLQVQMRHRVGGLALDIRFALTQPWTVLFGPSGSGKTTVLRAIAGFVRPDDAVIRFGDCVLVDRGTAVFVPAYARPVRSAAQTAMLFPQQTVAANLLYGSRWSSRPEEERALANELLGLFRITGYGQRMEDELSGGERQRVSVARAVFAAATRDESTLLLLDEPFSGMDVALRDQLLTELREWLLKRGIPVLSVTHDVGEAFHLSAEVIRIADGKVAQQGPVEVVLAEERRRILEQLRGEQISAVKQSPA